MTYKELLFKMARREMLTLSNDKDGRGLFWVSMNNLEALDKVIEEKPLISKEINRSTEFTQKKNEIVQKRKTFKEIFRWFSFGIVLSFIIIGVLGFYCRSYIR